MMPPFGEYLALCARRLAIGGLIVGGVAATVAMLLVMLSLSGQVARATLLTPGASQQIVFAPPGAGSVPSGAGGATTPPQATPPPADDGVGTSVANAMTAVGTAVAAVTLILSIGTTWFAIKLKDIEQAALKLEQSGATYESRLLEMNQALAENKKQQDNREHARQLLIDARFALREWIDQNSAAVTRYSVLADLTAHLEMLMSASSDQRQRSYAQLTKLLPDAPGSLLAPVDHYARHCHLLHGAGENQRGIWCDVFDPVERAAYLKQRMEGQPAY